MPTYDYRCSACAHQFELFQSMKDAPKRLCPACGKRGLERLIGTGAAILFKGAGFYETDYRSESYRKAANADMAPPPDAKPQTAPGSKPDAKPGANPEETVQKPAASKADSQGSSAPSADAGASTRPASRRGRPAPRAPKPAGPRGGAKGRAAKRTRKRG